MGLGIICQVNAKQSKIFNFWPTQENLGVLKAWTFDDESGFNKPILW